MNEVESFEMDCDQESLNNSNQNVTGHMDRTNDSPIPRRINDSRMSDITVDLKNLKAKSFILEHKISEKAKEIAELESKVEEIDALRSQNEDREKRPSVILSRIEEHMFAIRAMQVGDISTIVPQSVQDDAFAPTLTKVDGKQTRVDSSAKVVQSDEFSSAPSTGQEETPQSKQRTERTERSNQNLIDSLVQENNNLRGMMNSWVQNRSPNSESNSMGIKLGNQNQIQGQSYVPKKK